MEVLIILFIIIVGPFLFIAAMSEMNGDAKPKPRGGRAPLAETRRQEKAEAALARHRQEEAELAQRIAQRQADAAANRGAAAVERAQRMAQRAEDEWI